MIEVYKDLRSTPVWVSYPRDETVRDRMGECPEDSFWHQVALRALDEHYRGGKDRLFHGHILSMPFINDPWCHRVNALWATW